VTTRAQRAAQALIVAVAIAAIAVATFGPRSFASAFLDRVMAAFVILFVVTIIVVAVRSARRS
jgi:preprotein translocase subunit SecG